MTDLKVRMFLTELGLLCDKYQLKLNNADFDEFGETIECESDDGVITCCYKSNSYESFSDYPYFDFEYNDYR